MSAVVQFFIGLLFGLGLIIAGMADPAKVLNFLDLAGSWDPSLAFVLGGAVFVAFIGYRIVMQRPAPVFDAQFHVPTKTMIDAPLVIGAAIFGIGWGMVGYCPGPALVALGTGTSQAITVVVAMIVGMVAARILAMREMGREAKVG
jgi:uncharacterized protein